MFPDVLSLLTDSSDRLREDVARVDASLCIRDQAKLRTGVVRLLDTMFEIVSDQATLFDLTSASGDPSDSPYNEALTYLTMAQAVVPDSMLRPAAVMLFLLHRSVSFSPSDGRGDETALLARMDEAVGSFGFGGVVSLVDLWADTAEYADQRRKLWAAVVDLLVTVGEECRLSESAA